MPYEVRAYQQEAIGACVSAFADRGCASVLLESPVGSGKTYMALETIHRLQERLGRRLRVNWVAPRHRLLQQMMAANRDLHQDDIRPVSLFERVLAAAHRHLTSVAREMNGLMWDPYMATAKGDARYYLRTHAQAVAS